MLDTPQRSSRISEGVKLAQFVPDPVRATCHTTYQHQGIKRHDILTFQHKWRGSLASLSSTRRHISTLADSTVPTGMRPIPAQLFLASLRRVSADTHELVLECVAFLFSLRNCEAVQL